MKAQVLIVDDQKEYQDDAAAALIDSPHVFPIIASGFKEAIEKAKDNFIVAAFVDLHILNPSDTGYAGPLLNRISRFRPTAKRVVFSQDPERGWRDMLELFDPISGIADAAWQRVDGRRLGTIIEKYVDSHGLFSDLTIEPLDEIVTSVQEKVESYANWKAQQRGVAGAESARVTAEEVHYIISQVLRTLGSSEDDQDRVVRIPLTAMTRGKSTSCVFKGNPETQRRDHGILCIIKLGPRDEVLEEIRAFDTFVRFARNTARRVEILSTCLGDTTGGVCYSFAGESPKGDGVESLQDVIERGDTRHAVAILRTELNPSTKEWYAKEGVTKETLVSFFDVAYGLRPKDHLDNPMKYAKEFMIKRPVGSGIAVGGVYADGPRRWYFSDDLRSGPIVLLPEDRDISELTLDFPEYRSCIVHGDMNGENLLIANSTTENRNCKTADPSEWVILIDYRQTRRGPVFVDFAALEATVRLTRASLSTYKSPEDFRKMTELLRVEEELLRKAWATSVTYRKVRDGKFRKSDALWHDLSFELVQLARGNFGNTKIGVMKLKREYIATCLIYGLRLLKIDTLSSPYQAAARARLMVWMSALISFLREVKRK